MLTESQIAERKTYLGASEAASVLGLNRWKTPLALWAEKCGQVTPEDIRGKLQVRLGHKLESVISELWLEDVGTPLRRVNETVFHAKYPFLAANLDRKITGKDECVEIKTVSAWRSHEFDDGKIPAEFMVQVMHQLACTGYKRAHLAILIGNSEFKRHTIERDEKQIQLLVEKEVDFWTRFVVPKVMPGIITAQDSATLLALFPSADPDDTVDLDDNADAMIESLQALKSDGIALEKQIEKSQNEVKSLLKDRAQGKSKRYLVSWKNVDTVRIDAKKISEKYPKIAEECAMKNSTRKFTVKSIKGVEKSVDD